MNELTFASRVFGPSNGKESAMVGGRSISGLSAPDAPIARRDRGELEIKGNQSMQLSSLWASLARLQLFSFFIAGTNEQREECQRSRLAVL